MQQQILIILKTLLKINGEDLINDTILLLYVEEAINRVLIYIKASEIPTKLINTTAFIAKDLYNNSENKEIVSINEDGDSITFKKLQENTILSSYEKTLNGFRKWAW